MAKLSKIWDYIPTEEDKQLAANINYECIDLTRMTEDYKDDEWPEEFNKEEEFIEQIIKVVGEKMLQDMKKEEEKQQGDDASDEDGEDKNASGDKDGEDKDESGEEDVLKDIQDGSVGGGSDEEGNRKSKAKPKPSKSNPNVDDVEDNGVDEQGGEAYQEISDQEEGKGAKPIPVKKMTDEQKQENAKNIYEQKSKIKFVDPMSWTQGSTRLLSDAEIKTTDKWITFKTIYDYVKNKINQLKILEMNEWQKGFMSGDKVNVRKYALLDMGGDDVKIFDREIVETEDETRMNIILVLDMSGSMMQNLRDYNASGVCLALVKALEFHRIRHSIMIYSDKLSLVTVDSDGKSKYSNVLATNMKGKGGTDVINPLLVAEEIVINNSDKKNILFVMSDGEVGDIKSEISHIKSKMVNNPMDVYLMGYGTDFVIGNSEQSFGKDYVKHSITPEEFAKQFLDIIMKELKNIKKGSKRG